MVVMGVGDEDRIERSQILGRRRWAPAPHVKDAAAEQRIRQQPQPGELREHGGMPDIREPAFGGQHYGVAPTCSRASAPSSTPRQPLRLSWTRAAPTIGSSVMGSSTGYSRNGLVCGPPSPPCNEIS